MRNRRILKILFTAVVAVSLVPMSSWFAGALTPEGSARLAGSALGPAVPTLSAPTSPAEPLLLQEAAQRVEEQRAAEATARAAEEARAARAAQRAARQRASREATRTPVAAAAAGSVGNDVWARLRQCESGGNYGINTGNGYYGAYQFALGTWRSLGYGGYPHEAPPQVQDEAARKLQARSGWGQWPACSRRMGVR